MIEELLVSHLKQNVPTLKSITPAILIIAEVPYAHYEVIYEQDIITLGGPIGGNVRFQINVYDKSYSGVKSLKDEIKTALYSFVYFPHNLSISDDYEDDTKLYSQILDFNLKI